MLSALRSNLFLVILFLVIGVVLFAELVPLLNRKRPALTKTATDSSWVAPSLYLDQELQGKERELVIYGEELIAHTSKYFGPKGIVAQVSNGMNCQNCHLDAGKRTWGNNYSAVYSTYPKFRERSGTHETIYKRISDCFERSLNGTPPDSNSREVRAIISYFKWLGNNVQKGKKPLGSGLQKLPYLDRAADTARGRAVYIKTCQTCHGANGEGQLQPGGVLYTYPPLWGPHSFNDAAGLYRLSNFASFVKNNMPFDQAWYHSPVLTNEEAWDVAAYVNSQPRPHKDQRYDWPNLAGKPIDFPIGPYADPFSEQQHKYGPFAPIEQWKKDQAAVKK